MAVFNKNSLAQISGFNNQILSGELVYQQKEFWNIQLENDTGFLSTAGATIDAQIIRRVLTNVIDTRNGLTFDISDYSPTPSPISLTITNRNDATGFFTLVMNESSWGTMATDPDLEINNVNGAGFSGRIKISFPVNGTTPAQDIIIFLFFIVRSDGIVVE
jgi:hypothetical protein